MVIGKITKQREVPIYIHFIDGYYYYSQTIEDAHPSGYFNLDSMLKLKGYTRSDIEEI